MNSLRDFLKHVIRQLNGSNLKGELLRGGIGSAAIKTVNIALGMVLVIVLAHALGPEGYGIYAYVFAIVSILVIPAQFGIPILVVRETAKAQANENWGHMLGIWRWASLVIFCLSAFLVLVGLAASWKFWDQLNTQLQNTLFFGLLLIPLIALGNLRGAVLQGLHRVVLGLLPENLLRPGLLTLLLLVTIEISAHGVTAAQAMGLHVAAAGMAFIIGVWFLYKNRPQLLSLTPEPLYEPRKWFMASWPLALTAGMQQINQSTDIIVLGIFHSTTEVGIYRVATQGAMLVPFGLTVVAMLVSPYFARLYENNDLERLQRLVTVGARSAFFIALPLVLVFLFWGKEIIGLLFGEDYTSAYSPLVILALGQLINTAFGHVGTLLNMTGHERDTARGVAIAAISNVLLNLILIPSWGIKGAALGTALTLIIWNILLWRSVYKRLGIQSMILSGKPLEYFRNK